MVWYFKCALAILVLVQIFNIGYCDSCDDLGSCLEDLGDQLYTCTSSDRFQRRFRRLERRCGSEIANLIDGRANLQLKRQKALSICLKGISPISKWKECSAHFKDPGEVFRKKRQTNGGCVRRQLRSQKNKCRQLARNCPAAKLCHLCYEQSHIHDGIKKSNFDLLRKRAAACAGPVARQRDAMPDQDEGFWFVNQL